MITTEEISNILVRDSKALRIPAYPAYNVPQGALDSERIVIVPGTLEKDDIWWKCFTYINICVPDKDKVGNADLIRIQELHRLARILYEDVIDKHDGDWYEYEWDSSSIENESGMHFHKVAVRVIFKVLNVKK